VQLAAVRENGQAIEFIKNPNIIIEIWNIKIYLWEKFIKLL